MAAYALLVGTKGESRSLIADGDPRVIRRRFKLGDFPDGFDRIEVIDTAQGRVRSKWNKKKTGSTVTTVTGLKESDPAVTEQPKPTRKASSKPSSSD